MSTFGSLVGGTIGAIGGFLIGGPVGALYGFTVGYGVGLMIDPPEVPSQGAPESTVVMTATEGNPVPDVIGSTKLSCNVIWVGDTRAEEVSEGGGGKKEDKSGGSTIISYEYYKSWAVAVCEGPISGVFTIWKDSEPVWSGFQEPPVGGGPITLTLNNMGTCRFYFGTTNQNVDTLFTGDHQPAYRGFCYAVFDDVNIGAFDRAPSMSFSLSKWPSAPSGNTLLAETINFFDYNPALALYYVMNNKLSIDTSLIDATSFEAVAETLRTERLGISMLLTAYRSGVAIINDILNHIGGIITYDIDGKFHLSLLRTGEAVDDLPSFDQDDVIGNPTISRTSWAKTINELKINYPLRICHRITEENPGINGDVGAPCPGVQDDDAPTISYSSPTMGFNENQTLTSSDGLDYEWSIRDGGGSLDTMYGSSVIYTSPAEGTGYNGATIDLLCCGIIMDSLDIYTMLCPMEIGVDFHTPDSGISGAGPGGAENPIAFDTNPATQATQSANNQEIYYRGMFCDFAYAGIVMSKVVDSGRRENFSKMIINLGDNDPQRNAFNLQVWAIEEDWVNDQLNNFPSIDNWDLIYSHVFCIPDSPSIPNPPVCTGYDGAGLFEFSWTPPTDKNYRMYIVSTNGVTAARWPTSVGFLTIKTMGLK